MLRGLQPVEFSFGIGDRLFRNQLFFQGVHYFQIITAEEARFSSPDPELGIRLSDESFRNGMKKFGKSAIHEYEAAFAVFGKDEIGIDVQHLL